MMKIKNIKFISVAAKEAELIVSDGVNECLVFSQPCKLKVGDEFFEPIKVLDADNLMKVINENEKERIQRSDESYFAHHCIVKVIDKEAGIVSIGGIKMELERKIPGWANEGDLIEFTCSRLDIW